MFYIYLWSFYQVFIHHTYPTLACSNHAHNMRGVFYWEKPYRTNKIDLHWHANSVDMQEFKNVNDGHRYLLMVIDIFSRYAWSRPLRTKKAKDVIDAFNSILEQDGRRRPKKLQTDLGKEFDNRHFRSFLNRQDIDLFVVNSPFKASLVERLNKTIKEKMYKYFTFRGSHRWIDVLPQIMEGYNGSIHRSIAMAPRDVNRENEMQLWDKQQSKGPQIVTRRRDEQHPTFKVGESVRISHAKRIFDKGYLPTWTDQVYTVARVVKTPKIETKFAGPLKYVLKDYNDNEIEGKFYGLELQKIHPPERFRVERVIRPRNRGRGGGVQYFVKWMGYGDEFNSWVDNLENI